MKPAAARWLQFAEVDLKAARKLLEEDILDTISTFNLQTRYDDYKMSFHRKCSRAYTEKWINEIKGFRKWIKNKLLKQ